MANLQYPNKQLSNGALPVYLTGSGLPAANSARLAGLTTSATPNTWTQVALPTTFQSCTIQNQGTATIYFATGATEPSGNGVGYGFALAPGQSGNVLTSGGLWIQSATASQPFYGECQ